MLLFQSKIQEPIFVETVKEVSNRLSINPNWLMLVMYFESGLRPSAVNSSTGATGLIQFMPATAAGLGTSTAALKNMSATAQLYYVERYLKPFAGKLNSFTDLYFAVFFPAALGINRTGILKTQSLKASTIARQNPVFDTNKNGEIKKNEIIVFFNAYIKKIVPTEYQSKFKSKPMKHLGTIQAALLVIVAVIAVLLAVRQYN
ncbi:MAG TPA: hypothetical protein DCQ31_07960 [Bacteroidales bacterium]|nr:hypothetical protein [Bacteroidales bacterium]